MTYKKKAALIAEYLNNEGHIYGIDAVDLGDVTNSYFPDDPETKNKISNELFLWLLRKVLIKIDREEKSE